jgi:hypothetical protein
MLQEMISKIYNFPSFRSIIIDEKNDFRGVKNENSRENQEKIFFSFNFRLVIKFEEQENGMREKEGKQQNIFNSFKKFTRKIKSSNNKNLENFSFHSWQQHLLDV